jgi:hypothetical protein
MQSMPNLSTAPIKRSTRRVIKAFRQGKPRHTTDALWTDGTVVYSFGIIVAAKSGRQIVVSPPAPTFGRYTRQRIAEIMALLPKAVTATAVL